MKSDELPAGRDAAVDPSLGSSDVRVRVRMAGRTRSSPLIGAQGLLSTLHVASSLLLVLAATADAASVPYGFQSGLLPSSNPPGTPPDESTNDDTYAGSIYYSPQDRLMYITGGTYGGYFDGGTTSQATESHLPVSDCFVGVLRAPEEVVTTTISDSASGGNAATSYSAAVPDLLFSRRYGPNAAPDVCSGAVPVALKSAPNTADPQTGNDGEDSSPYHLVAVGHAEEGGLMTDLRRAGTDKSTTYGFALDLKLDRSPPGSPNLDSGLPQGASHVGGRLFHESGVQYPVAVATKPVLNSPIAAPVTENSDKSHVYVVLQMSDQVAKNNRWDDAVRNPDITAGGGGGIQRYGHGKFGLEVKKLGWKYQYGEPDYLANEVDHGVKENMVTLYTQQYEPHDGKSVRASTLLYVPHIGNDGKRDDFLLLAGWTQGYGDAFGSPDPPGTNGSDGFVTKLDPETGLELKSPDQMTSAESQFGNSFSLRLGTQEGKSEVIHGVCVVTNADDVRDAYVVGSTTGVLAPDATAPAGDKQRQMFAVRLDLDTLNVEWRKQFGTVGSQDAYATGCAVDPSGGVYVGGVVEDGGVLAGAGISGLQSGGKDDIFLLRLNSNDGDVEWAKQIGTAMDERLATGGGVAVDEDGDAILFGTTRGSMMRMRGKDVATGTDGIARSPADAFVMSVSKAGEHRVPVEMLTGGSGGYDPTQPSDPTFPDQPAGGVPEGSSPPVAPAPAPAPEEEDQPIGMAAPPSESSKMSSTGIFGISLLASMVAVSLFFFAYKVGVRKAEDSFHARHSNDHVTQYLKDFEEVDIALRQSATGGWHGMYDLGDDAIPLGADVEKVPQEVSFELGMGVGVSSLPGDDTASISRSSIASSSVVKDNLFFDEDDEVRPRRGGGSDGLFQIDGGDEDDDEDGGEGKWGAGYAGLVESYNESWDHRSPHSMGGALLGDANSGLGAGSPPPAAPAGTGYKDRPDDKEIV